MSSIADYLRWGCGLIALLAMGLGVYMGWVKDLEGTSHFVFSVMLIWWGVGAVCSLILLGLSEILDVLERLLQSTEKMRLHQEKKE